MAVSRFHSTLAALAAVMSASFALAQTARFDPGHHQVWEMIREGNVEGVRAWLAAGGDPNGLRRERFYRINGGNEEELSPLLRRFLVHSFLGLAVAARQEEIAGALLDAGANVDAEPDLGGYGPLHLAAATCQRDLMQRVIDGGADINQWGTDAISAATPLHLAVVANCGDSVEVLLEAGADTERFCGWSGGRVPQGTPLILSAAFCRIEMCGLLIDGGANLAVRDEFGGTPLHFAAGAGCIETFEFLRARGAAMPGEGEDELPIVHSAVRSKRLEMVRHVLDLGAPVNALADGKLTALMTAAWANAPAEIAVELIQRGVSVNAVEAHPFMGGSRRTALMYAAESAGPEFLKVLLETGADPAAMSQTGEFPLALAARRDRVDNILALLQAGVDVNQRSEPRGGTALHAARDAFKDEAVRALVEAGADVNARDSSGWTPLLAMVNSRVLRGNPDLLEYLLQKGADPSVASQNGMTPIMPLGEWPSADILKRLLRAGAEIDARDQDGFTALVHYIHAGWMEGIQLLLASGADVNLADKQGRTPLMQPAQHQEHARHPIADLLLQHGADPLARDLHGRSVMHYVVAARLVPIYAEFGLSVDDRDQDGRTPLLLASMGEHAPVTEGSRLFLPRIDALLGSGADPNAVDADGASAILYAAWNLNTTLMRRLVEAGADIRHRDHAGDTVFCYAMRHRQYGHRASEVALELGADPNARGAENCPALIWSIRRNNFWIAFQLLDAGADTELRDGEGRTALMWAVHHGGTWTIDKLLSLGASPVAIDDIGRSVLDHARELPAHRRDREDVIKRLEDAIEALGGRAMLR